MSNFKHKPWQLVTYSKKMLRHSFPYLLDFYGRDSTEEGFVFEQKGEDRQCICLGIILVIFLKCKVHKIFQQFPQGSPIQWTGSCINEDLFFRFSVMENVKDFRHLVILVIQYLFKVLVPSKLEIKTLNNRLAIYQLS